MLVYILTQSVVAPDCSEVCKYLEDVREVKGEVRG